MRDDPVLAVSSTPLEDGNVGLMVAHQLKMGQTIPMYTGKDYGFVDRSFNLSDLGYT